MFSSIPPCTLLAGICPEDLQGMLLCLGAWERSFLKGEVILRQHSPADIIGVLLEGRAQVEQTDYWGRRSILTPLEPGDLFAEAFACAQVAALPVSVTATESCRVLMLPCQKLLHACDQSCGFHHQMIDNLMRVIARKNLALHRRAEITSRRTTRDKLLAYLAQQAQENGSSRFVIPFDRQGLADYLGVDRTGLSADISRLRREGVIECRKSEFRLLHEPEDSP